MARFTGWAVVAGLLMMGGAARGAPEPDGAVMAHVRADRWAEAGVAARGYADPVVARMVLYFRLMAPGAATTAEISAFMQASPDWPLQASLARRRDEAMAGEPDDAVLAAECVREAPRAAAALLRCAAVLSERGKAADGAALARRAWVSGFADAAWEQRFLRERGGLVTAADQMGRFERLLDQDVGRAPEAVRQQAEALKRQVARLAKGDVALAEARMALRRDDPAAPGLVAGLVAGLGEAAQRDPAMFLDQAQALRRAGQDVAAVALWAKAGTAAEKAAAAERRGMFWSERQQMARRRLRDGDPAGAYALAAGHAQTAGETAADGEFLAGFIALRRMNDPVRALAHFTALAALSPAAITQGRAQYWIGRAEAAAGHGERAEAAYEAGARGLMQIMPATGAQVARTLGLPVSVPALVLDPVYNMTIGSSYLRALLEQFAGAVPLVVAGYNAGPGRVQEWLRTNGDPRQGGVDMIDWIEMIPYAETRNYVQRVVENQVIYRARRGEAGAHPLAAWLK